VTVEGLDDQIDEGAEAACHVGQKTRCQKEPLEVHSKVLLEGS